MTNHLYISDVTGSFGCHNEDDKSRAIDAAEKILANVDAHAAMMASIARMDGDDHDPALAAIWEKAQSASNKAFTKGWAKPDNVIISLEAR